MSPRNDDHDAYDETYVEDSYDSPTDDDSYVDGSADDGEWTGEDDTETSQGEQPPPKKKKSNILTIVIVVVVAVLGVLGFIVMRGGEQPPAGEIAPVAEGQAPEQAPADQLPTNEQPPIVTGDQATPPPQQNLVGDTTDPAAISGTVQSSASAGQQPEAPQGLMDNPDLLAQEKTPQFDSPPAPAPVGTPDTAQQPVDGLAGAVSAVAPDVQPVSDFPTVDSIKKPAAPAEMAPVTAPAPELAAPVDTASAASLSPTPVLPDAAAPVDPAKAQLEKANVRIQELEKALADKGEELKKQQSQQVSTNTAEVDSLKAKVTELEEKLSAATKSATTQSSAKIDKVDEEPNQKAPEVVRTKSEPVAKIATSKPASREKAHWVLKSAKPGFAIIADKLTGDFKSVAVGDSVTGIGKVTAIGESPSGWVIQGTTGKISE